MARVKSAIATRKKHKKVLKQAKGYFGAKSIRFRNAKQAVLNRIIPNFFMRYANAAVAK